MVISGALCADRLSRTTWIDSARGNARIDALEELQDVDRGVALTAVGYHLAAGDVEGSEEIGCAVALVVMGHRARAPGA